MADTTDILGLPLILPAQAQKHVSHNEALAVLDVLVQLVAISRHRNTPPAVVGQGDCHIVGPDAQGEWQGQSGKIAVKGETSWLFLTPKSGWRAEVLHDGQAVVFDGLAWKSQAQGTLQAARLGVGGASPDAQTPFVLAGVSSLFNHAGAGHQLKVNKASLGDTASLLFQNAYSGRAEMGLAGNDAFAVKVSADGNVWNTGFSVTPNTGRVNFPNGLTRAGQELYGRDTILGTVSQTAGQPTGAILQRGSTASGSFIRFADGTLICQSEGLTIAGIATSLGSGFASSEGTWTYPSTFLTGQPPVVSGQVLTAEAWVSVASASVTQATFKGLAFAQQIWQPDCTSDGGRALVLGFRSNIVR